MARHWRGALPRAGAPLRAWRAWGAGPGPAPAPRLAAPPPLAGLPPHAALGRSRVWPGPLPASPIFRPLAPYLVALSSSLVLVFWLLARRLSLPRQHPSARPDQGYRALPSWRMAALDEKPLPPAPQWGPGHSAAEYWCRQPESVYIHIPFCRQRCHYCDFTVQVVGDEAEQSRAAAAAYLPTLLREIEATMALLRLAQRAAAIIPATAAAPAPPPSLRTLYFGGGTPSLLSPEELRCIVDAVHTTVGPVQVAPGIGAPEWPGPPPHAAGRAPLACSGSAAAAPPCAAPTATEVTLEADPGTFDEARMRSLVSAGRLTRISLGVQSLFDDVLRQAGRHHTHAQNLEAIAALQAIRDDPGTSLRSFSADLIAGLPGLTVARWRQQLQAALALGPDHLSLYDLQLEEGTLFWRWFVKGKTGTRKVLAMPPEDDAVSMWEIASQTLTAAEFGFRHYEVSNYARPGHESAHNRQYWARRPFLAFGVGATSHFAGIRLQRPKRLSDYRRWVDHLCAVAASLSALKLDDAGKSAPRGQPDMEDAAVAGALQDFWVTCFGGVPAHPPVGPHPLAALAAAAAEVWHAVPVRPVLECQRDAPWDECVEWLMLALRTSEGLALGPFAEAFGAPVAEAALAALRSWNATTPHVVETGPPGGEGGRWPAVRLSDPAGLLVSNAVLADVIAAVEKVFPAAAPAVRRLTTADAPVVLAAHAAGWAGAGWAPAALEAVVAGRQPGTLALGAFRAGRLAGVAVVTHVADEGAVEWVGTAPECRRQGIGRALLASVEAEARSLGLRMVTLEVRASNMAAIGLYAAAGYQQVGRRKRYYDGEEDALLFTLPLPPLSD